MKQEITRNLNELVAERVRALAEYERLKSGARVTPHGDLLRRVLVEQREELLRGLAEALAAYPRESFLLRAALAEDVPRNLATLAFSSLQIGQLTARLVDNYLLPSEAQWAVATWARALDLPGLIDLAGQVGQGPAAHEMIRFNEGPRDALKEQLVRRGLALCEEPQLCRALLRDLVAHTRSYPPEIFVLISALEEGIVTALRAAPAGMAVADLHPALAQHLVARCGFMPAAAAWAVQAWAEALQALTMRDRAVQALAEAAGDVYDDAALLAAWHQYQALHLPPPGPAVRARIQLAEQRRQALAALEAVLTAPPDLAVDTAAWHTWLRSEELLRDHPAARDCQVRVRAAAERLRAMSELEQARQQGDEALVAVWARWGAVLEDYPAAVIYQQSLDAACRKLAEAILPQLQYALLLEDDEAIAAIYTPTVFARVSVLAPDEAARCALAVQRVRALSELRAALHAGDPARIVRIADAHHALFARCRGLRAAERQQIQAARRDLLRAAWQQAVASGDQAALIQLGPAALTAGVLQEEHDWQTWHQTLQQESWQQRFEQALDAGDDQAVITAFDRLPTSAQKRLSVEQRARVDSVRQQLAAVARFHQAYARQDDLAIAAIYKTAGLDDCRLLNPAEHDCGALAGQRAAAWEAFARALASDQDELIAAAHDATLLEPLAEFTPAQRERARVAQVRPGLAAGLNQAWAGGEPQAIVSALHAFRTTQVPLPATALAALPDLESDTAEERSAGPPGACPPG